MSENLEGVWKGFTFKFITKEDYPLIMEHLLKVYCHHEPMMKYSGYTPDLGADFCTMARYALDQDPSLSFFVLDNNTEKVAGIQIADSVHVEDTAGFPIEFKSNQVEGLEHQLVSLVTQTNIFSRFGVDKYAEMLYTSVDPEFRCQGIATEIFRRSIRNFKSKGYSVCMSEFTSPATRSVGQKFGFVNLSQLNFKDFKDKDGRLILPNAKQDEFIVVAALRL